MDAIAGRLQIGTLWTQGLKLSWVFEGMCSLELVEVLDRPNSCSLVFVYFRNYVALQNFWLLKNSIETECGFSRSLDTCFCKI